MVEISGYIRSTMMNSHRRDQGSDRGEDGQVLMEDLTTMAVCGCYGHDATFLERMSHSSTAALSG